MKLLRVKANVALSSGHIGSVDTALNLERVQSIEYKPARTVESGDEGLGTINLEARVVFRFEASEPITLNGDEAERVWKIVEGYFEH